MNVEILLFYTYFILDLKANKTLLFEYKFNLIQEIFDT